MNSRRFSGALILAALAACALLATDVWPGLRGPESWRWGRRVLDPAPAAAAIVSGILFLAAHAALAARVRGAWRGASFLGRAAFTTAAAALVFLQMLALTAVEPGGLSNLARRVKDPAFTSYHTIAANVENPVAFLRDYDRLQSRLPVHGPSQPPGRVLFFWGVNRIAGGADAGALPAALLLLAAGALVVVPIAILAGGRCNPDAVASAFLLFATVPSFLLFTPQTDHLILLLTVSAAALAFESWRHAAAPVALAFALASGFVAGASLFVSLTSAAAIGAWTFALGGFIAAGVRTAPASRLAALAIAACAGAAVALAIPAALGMDWPAVARECVAGAHRIQVLVFRRTFAEWVGHNLVDFALFLGPPLAIATLVAARLEARALRSAATPPFALALFAALLVLDLSGKILGETGRIWMFLMPLALLGVAASPLGRAPRPLLVLAASQVAVLLALRVFLNIPG